MTDPVKEQLSACLDGELPEGELDLLLKQLKRDPQLQRTLGGYALLSEAIRGQRPVMASAGFADRVSAAIAAETAPASHVVPRVSRAAAMRWLRPAAGMAIAAGVAAVAVVSLQPASIQTQQIAANDTVAALDSAETAPSYTVPTNIDANTGSAFIPAARLTNYVVAHSEYSSPLGRRTVLSGVLSEDETVQDDPGQANPGQVNPDQVNVSGDASPQR